jgi:hypothetical protein
MASGAVRRDFGGGGVMQQQRNEANDMFQRIANEVADQVSKKNHDYGNSYFRLRKEWGVQSFGVRLGDKYHRLANLLKGTEAQVDESIEDTIRDVIGYCLLELAYRERNVGEDDRPGGDE